MSNTRIIERPEVRVMTDRRETTVRLKDSGSTPLVTRRRLAWLLACLAFTVFLFLTKGGTNLYFFTRNHLSELHDQLILAPEASLKFLDELRSQSQEARFRLQGIIYSDFNPVAVVNATTLGAGEKASVRVGRSKELITCLDIARESVEIKTSQGSTFSLKLD